MYWREKVTASAKTEGRNKKQNKHEIEKIIKKKESDSQSKNKKQKMNLKISYPPLRCVNIFMYILVFVVYEILWKRWKVTNIVSCQARKLWFFKLDLDRAIVSATSTHIPCQAKSVSIVYIVYSYVCQNVHVFLRSV